MLSSLVITGENDHLVTFDQDSLSPRDLIKTRPVILWSNIYQCLISIRD